MKVFSCYSLILSFVLLCRGFAVWKDLSQLPELDGKVCKKNETVFEVTVNTKLRCSSLCTSKNSCRGAFYQQDTGLCVGCSTNAFDVKESLLEAPGTVYLQVCQEVDVWWSYKGSMYTLVRSKLAFAKTRAACRSRCADVLHIETVEENNYIQILFIVSAIDVMYMGLMKDASDGKWKWLDDGSETTFFYWGNDEPGGTENENCMTWSISRGWRWADFHCDIETYFMCEKRSAIN